MQSNEKIKCSLCREPILDKEKSKDGLCDGCIHRCKVCGKTIKNDEKVAEVTFGVWSYNEQIVQREVVTKVFHENCWDNFVMIYNIKNFAETQDMDELIKEFKETYSQEIEKVNSEFQELNKKNIALIKEIFEKVTKNICLKYI